MKRLTAAAVLAAALLICTSGLTAQAEQSGYGSLSAQFRSYYLHRPFDNTGTQLSLAAGGWLDYASPVFRGLSFGLTGYTSQPVGYQDPGQSGASLLDENQDGYSVLGQAWLKGAWRGFSVKAGRQIMETPMINSYDVKMTPVTLEAVKLTYTHAKDLTLSAAHLWGIKGWTDTAFQSLSRAAGLGAEESVTLAGGTWRPGENLSVQVWNYYCHEFMNMIYGQVDYFLSLSKGLGLTLSAQGIHQQDLGDSLAGEFNTGQAGVQGVLSWQGLDFTLGFTATSENHDIVNPWGAYPGFTSIMEEDRDRAGENSMVLGLAYDFGHVGVPGLSAYTMHTIGCTPDSGPKASPDQTEHDLTIDYRFPKGALKGLWIRVRGAMVDEDPGLGGNGFTDFRIIINYPLKIL